MLWNLASRTGKLVAGSFIFVEAAAFRQIGGFNHDWFAAEELELCQRLKKLARQTKRRIVTLTSDNGGAKFLSRNLPLRGEKQMLDEDGIRVPLILRWPAVLPAGKVFSAPVSAMDLTTTIAAAGGAKARHEKPFDGLDLIPALTGKADPDESRPLFRPSGGR